MEFYSITIILFIIFLIILSAFFSGSETALTAASRPRMHQLEKENNLRAKIVNFLKNKKEKLIGTLLLGNNLVNTLATALATSFFINFLGDNEKGVFVSNRNCILHISLCVVGTQYRTDARKLPL